MKKAIATSVLLVGALFTSGCTGPTTAQYLNAGVAVINNLSTLPNLTAADKTWLAAASNGFSCSAGVLSTGITGAQQHTQIGLCFADLPIVPAGDQPYISAGISVVQVFIALFGGGPPSPPVPSASQATIKAALSVAPNTIIQEDVKAKAQTIRSRLGK